VEADLFLLLKHEAGYLRAVGEVKANKANAWWATVENLRQLRLLSEAAFVSDVFERRNSRIGSLSGQAPVVGMVIAPREWYLAYGKKANSVQYARKLIHAIGGHCKLHLTVWDREQKRITELS
jgi:hypothetical protein